MLKIVGAIFSPLVAMEESATDPGDWSEETGVYTNDMKPSICDFNSGYRNNRFTYPVAIDEWRAVGTTYYQDVRHYAKAQMTSLLNNVITDSDRVGRTTQTTTRSPWTSRVDS